MDDIADLLRHGLFTTAADIVAESLQRDGGDGARRRVLMSRIVRRAVETGDLPQALEIMTAYYRDISEETRQIYRDAAYVVAETLAWADEAEAEAEHLMTLDVPAGIGRYPS